MRFERILVLDDELIIRKTLQEFLSRKRYKVRTASTLAEAMDLLMDENEGFDLMFLDVNLPDGLGTDVLEALQGREDAPIGIMITGQGTIESAVKSMKLGAFDYLLKPFSNDEISILLEKAEKYHKLIQVNQGLTSETTNTGVREIIGKSDPMLQLQDLISSVAQTDATVLINGETGTGKELISHAIHNQSPRRNKPFIKVNCAAVSETLIESEFFGHEKGAFTGAVQGRIGRFELADGGTLLLDEVSEISLPLQAKLLRVLQEREFERVGGNKTIRIDTRIVATTNRNLLQSVKDGEFREDLYYRLNVFPLRSPSLRERKEDIPQIASSFLSEFTRKHGRKLEGFCPEALQALLSYDWPGNVRELQNIIERAVILSHSTAMVSAQALPLEVQMNGQISHDFPVARVPTLSEAAADSSAATVMKSEVEASSSVVFSAPVESPVAAIDSVADSVADEANANDLTLASAERRLIFNCLTRFEGNRTQAAEAMGISIRTLRNKLSQYRAEERSEFEVFS